MTNRVIELRLLGGDYAGNQVFIPRINIYPTDAQIPFQLCRQQYALRLAFCMSINKSQGQLLQHVGLDFRSPVFTHGQFYVATVYRIKMIWDVKSLTPTTKNIVYPEVLLD